MGGGEHDTREDLLRKIGELLGQPDTESFESRLPALATAELQTLETLYAELSRTLDSLAKLEKQAAETDKRTQEVLAQAERVKRRLQRAS